MKGGHQRRGHGPQLRRRRRDSDDRGQRTTGPVPVTRTAHTGSPHRLRAKPHNLQPGSTRSTALSNGTAVAQERDTTDHVVECLTLWPANNDWMVGRCPPIDLGSTPACGPGGRTPQTPAGRVPAEQLHQGRVRPERVALDFNAGRFPSGPEHVDLWVTNQSPNLRRPAEGEVPDPARPGPAWRSTQTIPPLTSRSASPAHGWWTSRRQPGCRQDVHDSGHRVGRPPTPLRK